VSESGSGSPSSRVALKSQARTSRVSNGASDALGARPWSASLPRFGWPISTARTTPRFWLSCSTPPVWLWLPSPLSRSASNSAAGGASAEPGTWLESRLATARAARDPSERDPLGAPDRVLRSVVAHGLTHRCKPASCLLHGAASCARVGLPHCPALRRVGPSAAIGLAPTARTGPSSQCSGSPNRRIAGAISRARGGLAQCGRWPATSRRARCRRSKLRPMTRHCVPVGWDLIEQGQDPNMAPQLGQLDFSYTQVTHGK